MFAIPVLKLLRLDISNLLRLDILYFRLKRRIIFFSLWGYINMHRIKLYVRVFNFHWDCDFGKNSQAAYKAWEDSNKPFRFPLNHHFHLVQVPFENWLPPASLATQRPNYFSVLELTKWWSWDPKCPKSGAGTKVLDTLNKSISALTL